MYQNNQYIVRNDKTISSKFLSSGYYQFCTMQGLKQLTKSPKTCSTSTLIDHILVDFPSRVSEKGVIDVGISDHQLIFCTLNILCVKTGGIHKYLNFRSFKNYTVDSSSVEVLEKLNARDKRFNEFKKSRLNIDKELYKKANKNCLKIDCNKKTSIFSETINKPKDL